LQNSVPKVFHLDTDRRANFVKFRRREIGDIVCCLPDKKSPGSPAVDTARIALTICRA